mgnify:CR=1 FL=1
MTHNKKEQNEAVNTKTLDNNIYSIKSNNGTMAVWDENNDSIENYVNKIKNDVQDEETNNCVIF